MISYEEFTKQEAKLENATLEERKAFYADILKKEPEKTGVRVLAYSRYALQFYRDGDYRAAAQEGEKHVACHEAVATIKPQHPDEDGHYEDEDGELPHGHTQQQRRGILHRHHKISDGTYHRKEYHTAHPLAVKHEDKREIDQRRTRLLLQKY